MPNDQVLATDAIRAAATRIAPFIRRTPCLALHGGELGWPVTLKLEFLQHSGSFKARGAFNRMLAADVPPAGVVAASGGNHGAAVAFAAAALGHPATIFVPETSPEAKRRRIRDYGATLVVGGADYAAALATSQAWSAAHGALNVHAYDQEPVLDGQGTAALELAEDAPGLTHVLVAVGGGGLIGGFARFFEGSGTQVVGVEPEGCPTLHAALAAGRPVPVSVGGIAADSLGAGIIGARCFDVARRTGLVSVLVPDAAILEAQAFLWERLRIASEPGGAASLAALLSGAWVPPQGSRVGVLLCGANTGALPQRA